MGGRESTNNDELGLHLLVIRCQTGDERAFAQLFDRFSDRTLRYLRGLLGDAGDDVQQEVWLSVYRGISSLANPRAFRTWLFRTTRHRAVDFLRRQKRERELIENVALVVDERDTQEEPPAFAIDDAAVLEALATLPAVQREVLVLRYQNDLSYAEVALVIGCSIGTVRSRLHHAKKRLQELLERGYQ
jgi:RNA polymerase sigma-70 factor (ECF subfamily)